MTKSELYDLLQAPETIDQQHLTALRSLVESYPWCSTFTFLYLYALAKTEDVRYSSELRRLSIYLPDRSVLYRLVEDVEPAPSSRLIHEKSNTGQSDSFALIDSFLHEIRTSGVDLPDELHLNTSGHTSDYFLNDKLEPREEENTEPSTLIYESELINTLSDLTKQNKNQSEDEEEQAIETPLSTPSVDEDLSEELFTETLAKIYIQQGRYDKALRIIRSISLNYPKKNRYFAIQIRYLERLIENSKDDK